MSGFSAQVLGNCAAAKPRPVHVRLQLISPLGGERAGAVLVLSQALAFFNHKALVMHVLQHQIKPGVQRCLHA